MTILSILSILLTILFCTLVVVPAALLVAFPIIVKILAPQDKFFTYPEPGKVTSAKVGESPYNYFVVLPEGKWLLRNDKEVRYYNTNANPDPTNNPAKKWQIVDGKPPDYPVGLNPFKWMLRKMGAEWVGIYPWCTIHKYNFRGRTVEINADNITRPKPHNELSKYVMNKRVTYYSLIRPLTKPTEMLKFELEYVFDAECEDPELAFYGQDEWFVRLTAISDALAVRFFANSGYSEINAEDHNTFREWMEQGADEIRRETGFKFTNPRICGKNEGDNDQTKAYVKSCSDAEIAEQKGLAEVMTATQRALARKQKADGDSYYIEKTTGAQNNAVGEGLKKMSEGAAGVAEGLDGKSWPSMIATAISTIGLLLMQSKLTGKIEDNQHDEDNHHGGNQR